MTRSSIVAAVVVTLLLALLIWWRDEHSGLERSTKALNPASMHRSTGAVMAVPAARPVSPSVGSSIVPAAPAEQSDEPRARASDARESSSR